MTLMNDIKLCVDCRWHTLVEWLEATAWTFNGDPIMDMQKSEHQCHHPKQKRDPRVDPVTGETVPGTGREFRPCDEARRMVGFKPGVGCAPAGNWFEAQQIANWGRK